MATKNRHYWQVKTGITTHWRIARLSTNSKWLYFVFLDFAAEMDLNGKLSSPDFVKLNEKDFQNRSGLPPKKFQKSFDELRENNLITQDDDGVFEIANYAEHQPELSSGNERVRRYRDRKRNANAVSQGVTCNVTCNDEIESDVTERNAGCNGEKRREEKSKEESTPPNPPGGGDGAAGAELFPLPEPDPEPLPKPKSKRKTQREIRTAHAEHWAKEIERIYQRRNELYVSLTSQKADCNPKNDQGDWLNAALVLAETLQTLVDRGLDAWGFGGEPLTCEQAEDLVQFWVAACSRMKFIRDTPRLFSPDVLWGRVEKTNKRIEWALEKGWKPGGENAGEPAEGGRVAW